MMKVFPDIDFSNDAFPFMTFKKTSIIKKLKSEL